MKNLVIKWTISKAQETYGWNRVTICDGDKKYNTCGGGYDMLGTVFAYWLWQNYKETIIETIKDKAQEFYGFHKGIKDYYIDGSCGLDCMIKIAKEIGLKVNRIYHKGTTTNFIVQE